MRIAGGIVLVVVATVIGLFGALMLGASGVSWVSGGVNQYSDSDDSERAIGIAMGVAALIVWALLTWAAFAAVRGHRRGRQRASTVAGAVLMAVSIAVVGGATVWATSTPATVVENPPAWNRA
ncbi:hypothetical protein M3667_04590 [Microbacterium sp. P26]|uniref:hypothetical protein n=1 Tax=Microbacterium TaxID=33882 RepID=UPI00203FAAF6|nr:hypothetical protein [Microbacterium sp. P26]MCM3501158.1 hypothetical protein [Microbacterium sp. P26]